MTLNKLEKKSENFQANTLPPGPYILIGASGINIPPLIKSAKPFDLKVQGGDLVASFDRIESNNVYHVTWILKDIAKTQGPVLYNGEKFANWYSGSNVLYDKFESRCNR